MMTDKEFDMTFGQWVVATKDENVMLDEFGDISYTEPKREKVKDKYHDLWEAERKEYRLRKKNEDITNALMSLKEEGIPCTLCSYLNGHITAKTKHGIILSYYATTGTIAGYRDTTVTGLDEFIRLCKK